MANAVRISTPICDITARGDNGAWSFASVLRNDDGRLVTDTAREVQPEGGLLVVDLIPGLVEARRLNKIYRFLVPEVVPEGQTLAHLLEDAISYPANTPQELLDAAVGKYVETNRNRFKTRAVPITSGPNIGKAQWVDANDDPVGEPVTWDQVIGAAVAEAAATAAANNVTPTIAENFWASQAPQVVAGTEPGTVRQKFGSTYSPNFPAVVSIWSAIADKPEVDPLEFGAVGDGVTDDGAALEAACAAAKAVNGQVVLRRLFLTNRTIVQNDNFGIVGLRGNAGLRAGPSLPVDAPILWTTFDGSTQAQVQSHVYGSSVRNIRLDGAARTKQCIGWRVDRATNLDVYKVDIHNVDGPGLLLGNSVRETEFIHVHVRCCANAARDVAAIAINQNGVNDPHNNLHFYGLYGIWSYGVALDVTAVNSVGPVRNINFHSPMFHGLDSASTSNDDLTVTRDWRHYAAPLVRIRGINVCGIYSPRLHLSGYGQPMVQISNSPFLGTTQNWATIADASYGKAQSISQVFTADAGTDQCASTGVKLGTAALVRFTTTGTLPAPLAAGVDYYAIRVDDDTFKVATNRANAEAGTAINITDTGSGTHTVTAQATFVLVEASNVVDVQITGGKRSDEIPNRAAVVNKAGNGLVQTSRFTDPNASMVVYEPFSAIDAPNVIRGKVAREGLLQPVTTTVVKSTNTARTSTTSAADPDLVLPLTVGTWAIQGWILYDGSTTGDFKPSWTSDVASWTGSVRFSGQGSTATSAVGDQSNEVAGRAVNVNRGAVGVGTKLAFQMDGVVTVDAAGSFQFRWAQLNTDAVDPTTVYAGSWITATKLA